MFNSLSKFVVKYRWLVIVFWIIAIPVAMKTLPSLSSETTSSNSAFLPATSPSQKAENLITPFQGKNTNVTSTIVAASSNGPLTPADNQAITQLEAKVKNVSSVSIVKEQDVSSDGQVAEILVGTSQSGFSMSSLQFVKDIRATFTTVNAPANLSFHLTGQLAENADSNNSSNSARNNTQIFIFLFIIILLFVVYRSLLAPFITLIPAAVALVVASPIIAESTKIGVEVSPITQLLLIVLLLGAGTDYGIFLVFRVREALRLGREPKEAVIYAMSHVGKVITFSALTVSAALISLLLASFGFYKGLGPSLAIGMVVLLLAGLTLLPALLTVFGRAAFWPIKNKQVKTLKLGVWGRVADRVIMRPVLTLFIGILLLGGLSLGLIGYKIGGFNNSGPPANTDSAKGSQIINQHFPAANNNPEILLMTFRSPVWQNLSNLAKAQSELGSNHVFKSVSGPINIGGSALGVSQIDSLYQALGSPSNLPEAQVGTNVPIREYEAYRSLAQFISPDGKTVEFYALFSAGPSGSTAAADAVPSVRTALSNVASSVGATNNGLLSEDGFIYDISHISTSDLQKIVPVVLIVIGILLAILLQSLVAPWYLILTVGLSYLATLGFANIVFVHLTHNSSGLVFILPFLLFIFSMALGEDYNILVMSRIREEAHDDVPLSEAITRAVGVTGTTVTSAGLILAGTFTVLGISGGQSEVQQIGFSIAFGILLDTFFVRTLLVPSIAVILGKWNWWPSPLYKRTIK